VVAVELPINSASPKKKKKKILSWDRVYMFYYELFLKLNYSLIGLIIFCKKEKINCVVPCATLFPPKRERACNRGRHAAGHTAATAVTCQRHGIKWSKHSRSWSEPSSERSSLLFMNGNRRLNEKFFFFLSRVDCCK
jgi:hypothetical protein